MSSLSGLLAFISAVGCRWPGARALRMFAAAVGLVWLLCGAADPYDLIRAKTSLAAQLDPRSYVAPIVYVTSLPMQRGRAVLGNWRGRSDCPD